MQLVLSTQKVVYAQPCPQPEKLSALGAAKPTQEACESVSLCQCAAEIGAPVPAAGLPNTQQPTLG